MPQGLEVEIKIRLEEKKDFELVKGKLGKYKQVQNQVNYYFDGSNKEISSVKGVFRIRIINNEQAVLTFKGKGGLQEGISSVEETEEDVDLAASQAALADISLFQSNPYWQQIALFQQVLAKHKITQLVLLGHIKTQRFVFEWENHKLELDESDYGFATNYEIEVETETPNELKLKLESALQSWGAQYAYSKASKFANFMNKAIAK